MAPVSKTGSAYFLMPPKILQMIPHSSFLSAFLAGPQAQDSEPLAMSVTSFLGAPPLGHRHFAPVAPEPGNLDSQSSASTTGLEVSTTAGAGTGITTAGGNTTLQLAPGTTSGGMRGNGKRVLGGAGAGVISATGAGAGVTTATGAGAGAGVITTGAAVSAGGFGPGAAIAGGASQPHFKVSGFSFLPSHFDWKSS